MNVMESGDVVGDGVADDQAAIQSVIGQAKDGDEVYFPSGKYLVDTLYVNGKNSVRLHGPGTIVTRNPNEVAMRVAVSPDGIRSSQVVVDGLTIKGAIVINGARNVRITNCLFPRLRNCPGVRIFSAHDVTIENCTFDERPIGVECHSPDTLIRTNLFRGCQVAIESSSAATMIDHNRMFPFPTDMGTGILISGKAQYKNLIQITHNHIGHPAGHAILCTSEPLSRNRCLVLGNQFMQVEGQALTHNVYVDLAEQQVVRVPRQF